jgi:endonuclease/exonuclease/phosphatase family metal-dependent hydrolase
VKTPIGIRTCGLLVLAVLAACSAPSVGEPPRQQPGRDDGGRVRLTVATWNLYWLHAEIGEGHTPRAAEDYARLRRYAALLDADVVALQEVDGERAARRVFDPSLYSFHFSHQRDYEQLTGFAFRKGLHVRPQPDVGKLALGGTRRGADVALEVGGNRLRMLNVHLKAGCWNAPLDSSEPACRLLAAQLRILEDWIDARAAEGVPFVVLGDFNRNLGPADPFWNEIDDGDPPAADLSNVTEGRTSRCWGGRFPRFVDHIVLDRRASAWWVPDSFRQLLYERADALHREALSDHCPVVVTLDLD